MMAGTPLRLQDTVQAGQVGHRLALGVQWLDALTQLPAAGDWVSDLLAIGARPCAQRLDAHALARHAVRHTGRVARLLAIAATDKAAHPPADMADDPTNFLVQAHGRIDTHIDARRYVPRRLSLTPVQSAGLPPANTANIRTAWLWPGATYPLPANTTALRGRVQRGADLANATAVPWARIMVTRALSGAPNFAAEAKLAFAHGDDRGEFLVALGASALPGGAALPTVVDLRVWVFLPPAGTLDDAAAPLDLAGTEVLNDVLRGTAVPPTYLPQTPIDITVPPGQVAGMDDGDLLFP